MKYAFKIGKNDYSVEVGEMIADKIRVVVNGNPFEIIMEDKGNAAEKISSLTKVNENLRAEQPVTAPTARPVYSKGGGGAIMAPIPGQIVEIKVNIGDSVVAGQWVATMEAMKMENQLTAPLSGVVKEIHVQKGSEVNTGQLIMTIG